MVKIKQKKTMNLPQLIEWGFENDVTREWYRANNTEGYISEVFFNEIGLPKFSNTVDKSDTFIVEVKEEITGDTHLDYLYMLTDSKNVHRCNYYTIKNATKAFSGYDFTFFTLVNNDLVKIYENGRLVE
ncbi:hypothetical protein QI204_03445 [Staphylococcus saprophyticus]|uniref:hypothetical protein n=1 Tax=Staphylococcus saprophyticus TaxID=29385 RepID=UPI002973EB34|nr:hypothetical protein [Staphylococcus saprophyticus]